MCSYRVLYIHVPICTCTAIRYVLREIYIYKYILSYSLQHTAKKINLKQKKKRTQTKPKALILRNKTYIFNRIRAELN